MRLGERGKKNRDGDDSDRVCNIYVFKQTVRQKDIKHLRGKRGIVLCNPERRNLRKPWEQLTRYDCRVTRSGVEGLSRTYTLAITQTHSHAPDASDEANNFSVKTKHEHEVTHKAKIYIGDRGA